MQETWLTIVTVCLDSARTIERTLDSVAKQDLTGVEYIVVDGGSSDGTVDIVRSRTDMEIRVISEPDKGIYDAMNKGITIASGDYILLLNSDDELLADDMLATLRGKLRPESLNYAGVLLDRRGCIVDTSHRRFAAWKMWYRMEIYHPGLVVHRDQYRSLGLYDLSLRVASDADMIFRLVRAYPLNQIPFPIVRMHSGGISTVAARKGYKEFSEVTSRYGMPRFMAFFLCLIKTFMFTSRTG